MNTLHKLIITALGCIVLRITPAEAVECYVCQSEVDAGCDASPPSNQFLKNCSNIKEGPKYVACRKMENWVDFTVLDQKPTKRITRQCAADVDKDRPCYYRAGFGGRANVCDCFDDRCNSASVPVSSLIVLAVTLVVFLKSIS